MLLLGFGHNFNLCNNLELANCFSMHLLSYKPHKMLLTLESLMQSSVCVFAYKNRIDQMQVSLAWVAMYHNIKKLQIMRQSNAAYYILTHSSLALDGALTHNTNRKFNQKICTEEWKYIVNIGIFALQCWFSNLIFQSWEIKYENQHSKLEIPIFSMFIHSSVLIFGFNFPLFT